MKRLKPRLEQLNDNDLYAGADDWLSALLDGELEFSMLTKLPNCNAQQLSQWQLYCRISDHLDDVFGNPYDSWVSAGCLQPNHRATSNRALRVFPEHKTQTDISNAWRYKKCLYLNVVLNILLIAQLAKLYIRDTESN